ncbi:hypothetical protein ACIQH7_05830 [Streptomyces anulatus]
MTDQPRIALDDLTSDALDALYDDLDRYEEVVGELNEANTGLQREVARLTAAQCTDQLAVCTAHHLPPVAGCPYPRCRAAPATGRAATA